MKNIKSLWWHIKLALARYRYGNPGAKLKIIGVTGTNGKTTTATLLYRLATALGYKAGLVSTVEVIIAGDIRPATHTTPDSVTLIKLFHQMVDRGCEYVFMEVSSHALDQNRVAGINFTGGIFTNITHDHLDYHKNFENYFFAKKKFFQMLPPKSFAISNGNDEHGRLMIEGINAKTYLYGFEGGEDFHGNILKLDFSGLELDFNGIKVRSKLLGKFNAYNLLAVWGASALLGWDMVKVKKAIEHLNPPKGRFDYFVSPRGSIVVVDYAHTPDALEKILLAIREVKPQGSKIISVFGCGGDRDTTKRPVMGKIGANYSDLAIFTSDNPRTEDPDKIIDDMKKSLTLKEAQRVKVISNRRQAIREAVAWAEKDDVILVAGKGHEDYQEINGVKNHFDDMEELKKAFQQK